MKKSIIACMSCILISGLYVQAQNPSVDSEDKIVAVPSRPIPPSPPVPPAPPEPPVPPHAAIPPIPPPPPAPPILPVHFGCGEPVALTIVNSNGNEIEVRSIKGREIVVVRKDGREQRIRLSTWNKNRKYYERKYGHLPPPPPPTPPVEKMAV